MKLALVSALVPLLLLLASSGCASKQPAAVGPDTTITYTRVGGFAGFDDRLVIRGRDLILTRRNKPDQTGTAPQERLDALYRLLNSPEFQAAERRYTTSGGADQITYTIDSGTKTVTTIDGAEHPEAINEALRQLNDLIAIAAGIPINPS